MYKITFLIFILIFTTLFSFSQRTLLEEDIRTYDFEKPMNGPNMLHFTHWYVGLGFFTPEPQEKTIEILYGASHDFTLGFRYKLKATNWLAFGADLEYNTAVYYFNNSFFNDSNSALQTHHDKEKLRLNNASSEVYIRFNFGKRGNIIGKFIDFAAYGLYNFDNKHIYIDKYSNPNFYNAKTVKTINSNLNYIEALNYGARFRIGYNRYAICLSYRLSDILSQKFKTDNLQLELPRLNIDFQVGLH